jgi:Spy/CpxP family protein refolding chaperone
MRTKLLIAMLGCLITGGVALGQPAAPQHRMNMMHNRAMFPGLKLTDQQKADAKKVWFGLQEKQIDVRAQLQHARLDYEQLASAADPDQKALSSKVQEVANLKAQLQQNKLDAWFAVNKFLTTDQQKVWKRVLEHPMMFERRARMNKMGNKGCMMMEKMGMMRHPGMMQHGGNMPKGMGPMMQQAPPPPDSTH